MNSDQIFGIIMTSLIAVSFIYYANHTKKIKKELNQKIKDNPEQKEKIKVIKSLSPSLVENNKKMKCFLGILIAIFFVFLIALLLLEKYNVNYETIWILLLSLWIFLFFLSLVVIVIKAKRFKTYIKNLLIQQYGDVKEDKNFQSLDMDQKNNFCFKILKYRCIVNNYTEKRVVWDNYISYENSRRSKTIKKVKNVFEYYYNLKVLGVKNISSDLLLEETIKESINELSKTKLIGVKIIDDYLRVSKMTVLHGYNKEDAFVDVIDVELFYNQIVQKILDNNFNKVKY